VAFVGKADFSGWLPLIGKFNRKRRAGLSLFCRETSLEAKQKQQDLEFADHFLLGWLWSTHDDTAIAELENFHLRKELTDRILRL
jgi:hypothetical protein